MNENSLSGHAVPCALVSVIVPAYNVEKYLSRCIDSILAQTYKNLEILLIDDGSTDSTGILCDQYALRDQRIRVIHQENQGLAEVRNIGIREAKGEYIQFVDSDDWIEPSTIETCYKYLQEYDADIVKFGFILDYEDGRKYHLFRISPAPKLMKNPEAVSLIFFRSYICTSSWDKFCKSSLFTGITYPRGKLYEDIYTTYKLVDRAEKVLSINDEFYHYSMRSGSIIHYNFSDKDYSASEATQECVDFITGNHVLNNEEYRNLSVGAWTYRLGTANKMFRAGKLDKQYISQLRKDIKPIEVLRCQYLEFVKKAQLIVFKYSIKLYSIIYRRLGRDRA